MDSQIQFVLNPKALLLRQIDEDRVDFQIDVGPCQPSYRVANHKLIDILLRLPPTFFERDVKVDWSCDLSRAEQDRLWQSLREIGLLLEANDVSDELASYEGLAPEWLNSLQYHLSVRDFPFLDMGISDAMWVDNAIMKQYDSKSAPPSSYQNFDTGKGMSLKYIEDILNDNEPFLSGHTLQAITTILDVAFGERANFSKRIRKNGYLEMEKILKAVPSGGGRHPAEAFVAVRQVNGLASGLYHYSVKDHCLEYLADVCTALDILGDDASFHILVAPCLERAMWRYRESRSWRAVLLDTGHVLGAIASAASMCDLKGRLRTDIDLEQLTNALKLDPNLQPVLGVMSL